MPEKGEREKEFYVLLIGALVRCQTRERTFLEGCQIEGSGHF